MEKHKFFGGPGAAPGLGVLHPYELTLTPKQGVYQWVSNPQNNTEGAPVGGNIEYTHIAFSKAAESTKTPWGTSTR